MQRQAARRAVRSGVACMPGVKRHRNRCRLSRQKDNIQLPFSLGTRVAVEQRAREGDRQHQTQRYLDATPSASSSAARKENLSGTSTWFQTATIWTSISHELLRTHLRCVFGLDFIVTWRKRSPAWSIFGKLRSYRQSFHHTVRYGVLHHASVRASVPHCTLKPVLRQLRAHR